MLVPWSRSEYTESQVFKCCDPNAGQNYIMNADNKVFHKVAELKYLG